MSKLRTADYIAYMLDSIEYLESFANLTSESELRSSRMHLNNAVRELEKIGEAANYIAKEDPTFAAAYLMIPWKDLYRVRIIIAHKYWKVDPAIIWKAMTVDLPPIRQVLKNVNVGSHATPGAPQSEA